MFYSKRVLSTVFLVLLFSMLTAPALAVIYQDGVYRDKAEGYNDEVIVKVIVRDGKITEITAENKSGEESEYFKKAEEGLSKVIIEKQSIEGVDAISGATGTSDSILKAMEGVFLQTQYIGDSENAGNELIADTPVPSDDASPLPSAMPEAAPTLEIEATEEPTKMGMR